MVHLQFKCRNLRIILPHVIFLNAILPIVITLGLHTSFTTCHFSKLCYVESHFGQLNAILVCGIMLNVTEGYLRHYAWCHFGECCSAQCLHAESHLRVVTQKVTKLCAILLSVVC